MSKAERKELEHKRRHDEIVDAAEKLFFAGGYESVTMDDIAKALDMSRATLYLSFRNKDDIYAAIAVRGAKKLRQMFRSAVRKGRTGIDSVRLLGRAYHEYYRMYPGYARASSHPVTMGGTSPATDELRSINADIFHISIEAIRVGIGDSSIREDVDPAMTTLFMLVASSNVLSSAPVVRICSQKYGFTQDDLYACVQGLIMRSIENEKHAGTGKTEA